MSKYGPTSEEVTLLNKLFERVSNDLVRRAYVEPVLEKLVKERAAGRSRSYEGNFKALRFAARQVFDNWKMECGSMSGTGLSKAAEGRAVDGLARSFMEVYFARLGAKGLPA